MSNPRPLVLDDPLDMDEARAASRAISRQRREVEALHEAQVNTAANAEAEYRKAYARAFIEAVGTAAEREAKAKAVSAPEAVRRDVAAGMVKAYVERLRGLEGERSMLRMLMEWSSRLNIDGRERIQQ